MDLKNKILKRLEEETIYEDAYGLKGVVEVIEEVFKESETNQLNIHSVSYRRELLIAFQENFYKGIHDVTRKDIEFGVDKYLSNL